MQLYYHYQGQAIQNNTEDQTSTSPATISKAPVLYPAEQFEECFAHLDMAGPPMAVHRLNAVNPPHLEPPRSLPSGSQQYMTSQSASGPAGEAQSRPESMVSDGDSFSYQGSPAPAHAWLTPAASPESSSVPSPQSCWSSTHHEADCLPQSWPAGQPQIPSYDMQLYMSTQGAEGTHESRSSATSTLQSQTNTIRHMNQGFGNDEDDEDTEDWNSLNGEEIDGNACYAKLLRLALMGSDRHAMALKDIYQWFRDHTNKPGLDPENKETKGWTNSVRHNLSMNHAFVRHSRPAMPSDRTNKKMISEWCLEPWAVDIERFLSTTRYRKLDANGNPKSPRPTRPKTKVANRSAAGRKGGLNAGRSRLASKKARQGRLGQDYSLSQYHHSFADLDAHHPYHQRSSSYPGTGYSLPMSQGYPYELQHQGYDELSAHDSPSSTYSLPVMGGIHPMPGADLAQQDNGPMYWHDQSGPMPYHG